MGGGHKSVKKVSLLFEWPLHKILRIWGSRRLKKKPSQLNYYSFLKRLTKNLRLFFLIALLAFCYCFHLQQNSGIEPRFPDARTSLDRNVYSFGFKIELFIILILKNQIIIKIISFKIRSFKDILFVTPIKIILKETF